MKFIKRLFKPVSNLQMNLPSRTLTLPTITMTGTREITIEQNYKLLSFSDNNLTLQCEDGVIQINGHSFIIKFMYPHEIILEGDIEEVKFHTS